VATFCVFTVILNATWKGWVVKKKCSWWHDRKSPAPRRPTWHLEELNFPWFWDSDKMFRGVNDSFWEGETKGETTWQSHFCTLHSPKSLESGQNFVFTALFSTVWAETFFP
jgi:hypothetical protein